MSDINHKQSKTLNNGMTSSTLTTADAGYFRLYFETGSGMEGTSLLETARKAVVIQVFKDLSNFINSPLSTNGLNNKVNIWVRDVNQILNATTANPNPAATNGVLGLATSFNTMPNVNNSNFGGIVDNEVWKTIHTGIDSYTNVRPPLSSNTIASGASGIYYHGMMAFNFSNSSFVWNTVMNTNTTTNIDLYTVVLHEITHALGFASLISVNGSSKFGTGFNYFSRYDSFLKSNTNLNLITQATGLPTMYNYQFNANLSNNILQPNAPSTGSGCLSSTVCGTAIKFNGTSNIVPVHTPNCFSNGSSLSHFEDECIGAPNENINNNYFVMTDITAFGSVKRSLKIEEKNALCDLGYNINANYNFGFGTTFQNTIVLGAACNGITVAGINDGIDPVTGVYTISGITDVGSTINNVTINMSTILSNDTNAVSFEGLEDVFVPTSSSFLSVTSGISSTSVNFHSSEGGLHLLRYVPINSLGQRGNITYIYVHLYSYGAGCAIDNTCNLVNNGDFEQNTSLPNDISQLDKACGWQPATSGTPDYFVQGAVSTNPIYPSLSVPCNSFGFENDLFGNATPSKKSYAGMGILEVPNTGGYIATEPIYTMLKTALAVNTSYQLSFNVSLTDPNSSYAIQMQAYLSATPTPSSSQHVAITNPSLLFTSTNYSTISDGWDHVVINIPPQSINNLRYLVLGGLNGVTFQGQPHGTQNQASCPITSYNPWPNTTYYYIDNVKLVPLYGATFNLPNIPCSNNVISDLRNYLTSCPNTGVFAGNGVTYNSTTGIYSFQYPTSATSTTVTYTYINSGCSITLQKTVSIANTLTPTFATIPILCQGSTPPLLPTTSTNSITGTWNPTTISTAASANYTFTPNAGQCANNITISITVTLPNITPTFTTIPLLCQGSTPPLLPTTSTNSITGTWNPATISTITSGNYTFTPNGGQCANSISRAIQVLSNTAFVTNADSFTVTLSSSVTTTVSTQSVRLNDTYNGGPLPTTIVGLPYTVVLTGTLPTFPAGGIAFNASTGIFTVQPNTTQGVYNYQYYLQNSCYNTPVKSIKIVVNRLTTTNRTTFNFCYSNTTSINSSTATPNQTLFNGATIGGQLVNGTNGTIVLVAPTATQPAGISSINANGTVTISQTLPGQISFYYKICSGGVCSSTITCDIYITPTIWGQNDVVTTTANGATNYNVLSNDQYRGTCASPGLVPATTSNVTITNVVNNLPYYSINPTNGLIQLNSPPIAGSRLLTYTLCDNVFPTLCQTLNVVITVPSLKGSNSQSLQMTNMFDIEKTSITPNPTAGKVILNFNDNIINDYKIELFDFLGRVLLEKQVVKDTLKYELDLSDFSATHFYIRLSDATTDTIFNKIIIKN